MLGIKLIFFHIHTYITVDCSCLLPVEWLGTEEGLLEGIKGRINGGVILGIAHVTLLPPTISLWVHTWVQSVHTKQETCSGNLPNNVSLFLSGRLYPWGRPSIPGDISPRGRPKHLWDWEKTTCSLGRAFVLENIYP